MIPLPFGVWKALAGALLLGALVAGAAYAVRQHDLGQQAIGEARVQALWDAAELVAMQQARETEHALQKGKDDALRQAQTNKRLAAAAAIAAADAARLLDSTVEAVLARSAADSLAANRKYTAAFAEVFGDCRARYQALGREAQGHADDSLMLQQAWPTAAPATTPTR